MVDSELGMRRTQLYREVGPPTCKILRIMRVSPPPEAPGLLVLLSLPNSILDVSAMPMKEKRRKKKMNALSLG